MHTRQSRRRFLTTLSLAGAASFVGVPRVRAAERALETTTVRILKNPGICIAPQYVAEELLRAEGFTEIRYIETAAAATAGTIAGGKVGFSMAHASYWVPAINAGEPVVLLAGVHVGCFELIANEHIRSIRDLKGKKVGVQSWGVTPHVFVSSMAA